MHINQHRSRKLQSFISFRFFNLILPAIILCLSACLWASSEEDSTKHWVGTWACAPYNTQDANKPSTDFDRKTLRQIVRVSIGGDTVRLQFSNITSSNPVTMNKVTIATAPDSSKSIIDPATLKTLTFGGNENVTIIAKSDVYSDPIAFNLQPGSRIAISIYYGHCKSSSDMTFHYGSRTPSYIVSGDQTESLSFNNATTMERWFTIYNIEVLAPETAAAVAVIGNSITDGTCLEGGGMKWTDWFSEALLNNDATKNVSVLNLGIGATLVTRASNGAEPGIARFQHDVLGQKGVKWVIIFYGVNDLAGGVSASSILNGIKTMSDMAHAKDTSIKVYGATITPFQGYSNSQYTSKETERNQFNEQLPTQSFLDGYIDFEKAIQDPNKPTRMNANLQCDYLHPNAAGYKALGESIDLEMFLPPPVKNAETKRTSEPRSNGISATMTNNNTAIAFDLPKDAFVSCKVYSLQGKEIAEIAGKQLTAGSHTLSIGNVIRAKGMYMYKLSAGGNSFSNRIVLSGK